MTEPINVISLFDGMSCLQITLNELGCNIGNYYASEIDKHAIKSTQYLFPNTIQVGSVIDFDVRKMPKIHVIGGGSPCTDFSFSGKMKGMETTDNQEVLTLEHYLQLKSEGFQFEGQSYLFWEYMRVLKDIQKYNNPDVIFFLENVVMTEKWESILTRAIGVKPIMINAALVSAQQRKRLYWTNIGQKPSGLFGDLEQTIPQPKDRGILLKHILETDVPDKYFLSDKMLKYFSSRAANFNQGKVNIREEEGKATTLTSSMASCDISDNFVCVDCNGTESKTKAGTFTARYGSPTTFGSEPYIKIDTSLKVSTNQDKANCFTAGGNSGGLHSEMTLIAASRGRNPENPTSRKSGQPTEQRLEARNDAEGISPALCAYKEDLLIKESGLTTLGNIYDNGHNSVSGRVYADSGKSTTLKSEGGGGGAKTGLYMTDSRIRRLTPTEAGRLQSVPEHYIQKMIECGTSDTQLYRMYGNGWNIEVIKYIFSFSTLCNTESK